VNTIRNKQVKQLKVKAKKMYSKRIFGQHYQADLKQLSKELLVAKKEGSGDIFGCRSYKIKVDVRQSYICILNEVEEIEKISWRLRTIMASSSEIYLKRPTP